MEKLSFKNYFSRKLNEEKGYSGTEEEQKKYKALVAELTPIMKKVWDESENDDTEQHLIFRENSYALLVGVRKGPERYFKDVYAVLKKYPQFTTEEKTIHWMQCIVIEGPGIWGGYNDIHLGNSKHVK